MFDTILNSGINLQSMIICFISSIILGLLIALLHIKTTRSNKNFAITLSILPILVCVIIMLVNGNLGTSVAILGAFSLVRFRSIPGNSREIISIFFAMTVGLIIGTGYILFGIITTVVVGILLYVLSISCIATYKKEERILKILIPEDLDYTSIFSDILKKYTTKNILEKVKTTNMGSLYELTYRIELTNINEKEFIDEIRCRNGNLKIVLSRALEESEL